MSLTSKTDTLQFAGIFNRFFPYAHPVLRGKMRHNINHIPFAHTPRIVGRHGADNPAIERACRLSIPLAPEPIIFERGCMVAAL